MLFPHVHQTNLENEIGKAIQPVFQNNLPLTHSLLYSHNIALSCERARKSFLKSKLK